MRIVKVIDLTGNEFKLKSVFLCCRNTTYYGIECIDFL